MHAAAVLTGGEEALDAGVAGGIDDDTPHHEVGGRSHLDRASREVATEVAAASHHPLEVALDHVGAEVRDVDPHAAVGRPSARLDLEKGGASDEISR